MNEEIKDITFDEKKLMGPAADWYRQNKETLALAASFPNGKEAVQKIQAALMETTSGDSTAALATAQELFKKLANLQFDVSYPSPSKTTTMAHESPVRQPVVEDDGRYRYSGQSQGMVDQGTGEG